MTESDHNPAQQATSHEEFVGSDLLWVRLRVDRTQHREDWRDVASGLSGGELLDQRDAEVKDQQGAESKEQSALPHLALEQQVRDQLESIIGMIREQAQDAAQAPEGAQTQETGQSYEYSEEELKSLEELTADPDKFDDLIQKIMQAEQEGENLAQLPEEPEPMPDDLSEHDLPAVTGDLPPEALTATEELHWEIIPDLASYLESVATVTALETDGDRAQLFLLCERVPGRASLRTVESDSTGVLLPGQALADFMARLEEELPGVTDLLPQKPGEDYHLASFSQGTDSLILDPWGKSAALVELSMADLATYMQPELMYGEVEAAPADKGWSLLTADPRTLASLLETMNVPSIVAEKTLFGQNLTFVLPADSTGPQEGSVTDWVNQAMGMPDSGLVGSLLTFSWSPYTKIGSYLERPSSEVGNLVWSLPGLLPAAFRELTARDQLDQLIWLYGLNEQTANRLTNYVLDCESSDGLESTIHALALPEELFKVLTGAVYLPDFVGYRRFSTDMKGIDRLKESITAYPNGTDRLSTVNREIREHPWLLTADATAQLGASGVIALWAARRAAQGRSPKAALIAAATLGATGAAEMIIARMYQRLVAAEQLPPVEHHRTRSLSLTEELRAQAQQEEKQVPETRAPKALRSAQKLGRQAGQLARQQLGRFFGAGD